MSNYKLKKIKVNQSIYSQIKVWKLRLHVVMESSLTWHLGLLLIMPCISLIISQPAKFLRQDNVYVLGHVIYMVVKNHIP